MTSGNIAVLGSANMDLVVTVDRAPGRGETITGRTFRTVPGGKGSNQALAAARAGGQVSFLGAVGDDDFGRQITTLLADEDVDVSGLVTGHEPTGTAHITVDAAGDNSIVVVPGANGGLTTLTDAHRAGIETASLLLLQLELPLSLVAEAAAFARSRGIRTVLTPAPAVPLPEELLGVDVLVPNEHEAALLAVADDPVEAARRLAERAGDVVVTLGGSGALRVGDDGERSVPAFSVDAVDSTAAGDTFVGVLAVALADGMAWHDALRRATAAAALSVQHFGASSSMPTRDEIDTFLVRRSAGESPE